MYRGCLLLLCACHGTFDPDPPSVLAWDVRAMAIAGTHTVAVTDLEPNEVENFTSLGSPLPEPSDPEAVVKVPAAIDVAVGRAHACVLTPSGDVHCWGDHTRGALGEHRACISPMEEHQAPDCILAPQRMPSLPRSRDLAAGDDVTCSIAMDDDRVVCWGEAGAKLGGSRLPALDVAVPVRLPTGEPLEAARVIISRGSVCAIDRGAALWCWGDGFGATPQRQPHTGVVDVAIGRRHRCIIDDEGLACWGDNTNGQVGDVAAARQCGEECSIEQPHRIALEATRVVVGERHSCALLEGGDVACWGSNEIGQLGRDDAFLVGEIGTALSGAIDLAAGYAHTCAVRRDRSLWCWGSTNVFDREELP